MTSVERLQHKWDLIDLRRLLCGRTVTVGVRDEATRLKRLADERISASGLECAIAIEDNGYGGYDLTVAP